MLYRFLWWIFLIRSKKGHSLLCWRPSVLRDSPTKHEVRLPKYQPQFLHEGHCYYYLHTEWWPGLSFQAWIRKDTDTIISRPKAKKICLHQPKLLFWPMVLYRYDCNCPFDQHERGLLLPLSDIEASMTRVIGIWHSTSVEDTLELAAGFLTGLLIQNGEGGHS